MSFLILYSRSRYQVDELNDIGMNVSENENIYLTTTDMGLNIGLYLRRSEVTATEVRGDRYGLPTKKEQRASAYVSRKRMWRTPLEPSSQVLGQ